MRRKGAVQDVGAAHKQVGVVRGWGGGMCLHLCWWRACCTCCVGRTAAVSALCGGVWGERGDTGCCALPCLMPHVGRPRPQHFVMSPRRPVCDLRPVSPPPRPTSHSLAAVLRTVERPQASRRACPRAASCRVGREGEAGFEFWEWGEGRGACRQAWWSAQAYLVGQCCVYQQGLQPSALLCLGGGAAPTETAAPVA